LNIFSVRFNIFNLVDLKKLDKSKRNTYFWILVNIGIRDILTCSAFSLGVSCKLNRLIVRLQDAGAQAFHLPFCYLFCLLLKFVFWLSAAMSDMAPYVVLIR